MTHIFITPDGEGHTQKEFRRIASEYIDEGDYASWLAEEYDGFSVGGFHYSPAEALMAMGDFGRAYDSWLDSVVYGDIADVSGYGIETYDPRSGNVVEAISGRRSRRRAA